MKYIEKFGGYIADNPNIEFERCDGHVYSYDEVNTASMTNSSETLEITGGQGNFPLAILDTTKTLEFTFESSEFTLDMFAMANSVEVKADDDYKVQTSKRFEVEEGLIVKLPADMDTDSIFINGFVAGEAAAEGVYKLTPGTDANEGASADATPATLTFAEGDVAVGDTIRIAYKRKVESANVATVLTNSATAKGSLTATWPVYSAGTDCTEASTKALLHVFVPRVRVTALPGFDSSYKSAATQGLTFTALDPKRADEKMFDIIWEEL